MSKYVIDHNDIIPEPSEYVTKPRSRPHPMNRRHDHEVGYFPSDAPDDESLELVKTIDYCTDPIHGFPETRGSIQMIQILRKRGFYDEYDAIIAFIKGRKIILKEFYTLNGTQHPYGEADKASCALRWIPHAIYDRPITTIVAEFDLGLSPSYAEFDLGQKPKVIAVTINGIRIEMWRCVPEYEFSGPRSHIKVPVGICEKGWKYGMPTRNKNDEIDIRVGTSYRWRIVLRRTGTSFMMVHGRGERVLLHSMSIGQELPTSEDADMCFNSLFNYYGYVNITPSGPYVFGNAKVMVTKL